MTSTPPGVKHLPSLFLFAAVIVDGVEIGADANVFVISLVVAVHGAVVGTDVVVFLAAVGVGMSGAGNVAGVILFVGAASIVSAVVVVFIVAIGIAAAAPISSSPHAEFGPLCGMAPVDDDGATTTFLVGVTS